MLTLLTKYTTNPFSFFLFFFLLSGRSVSLYFTACLFFIGQLTIISSVKIILHSLHGVLLPLNSYAPGYSLTFSSAKRPIYLNCVLILFKYIDYLSKANPFPYSDYGTKANLFTYSEYVYSESILNTVS